MKRLIVFAFLFISFQSISQYIPLNWYSFKGLHAKSTFFLPTGSGAPSGYTIAYNQAALYYDSTNAKYYVYNPKVGMGWYELAGGGGSQGLQSVITTDPVLTADNTIDGGGFIFQLNNASEIDLSTIDGSDFANIGITPNFISMSGGTNTEYDIYNNKIIALTPSFQIAQIAQPPDSSALLELNSTAKGFLPPRLTTTQRDAISTPATGLQIFNTTDASMQVYNGSSWVDIGGSGGTPDWQAVTDVGASTTHDVLINGMTVGLGGAQDPYNIALGTNALQNNIIGGSVNVAIGANALAANTEGGGNTAIGYGTLSVNTTSNNNTAIGNAVLANNTGTGNTGISALALTANTSGAGNIAIGQAALSNNTTGGGNTVIGNTAGQLIVAGAGNVVIGNAAASGGGIDFSNKLYISGSTNLIYGDFSTRQVQINAAATPSLTASAALEIIDTTKGFLPPRLTTTQRNAIGSPATGLQIFNTTTATMQVYNGSAWVDIAGGGGGGTVTSIATTSPISGGTITSTGTISLDTTTASGGWHSSNYYNGQYIKNQYAAQETKMAWVDTLRAPFFRTGIYNYFKDYLGTGIDFKTTSSASTATANANAALRINTGLTGGSGTGRMPSLSIYDTDAVKQFNIDGRNLTFYGFNIDGDTHNIYTPAMADGAVADSVVVTEGGIFKRIAPLGIDDVLAVGQSLGADRTVDLSSHVLTFGTNSAQLSIDNNNGIVSIGDIQNTVNGTKIIADDVAQSILLHAKSGGFYQIDNVPDNTSGAYHIAVLNDADSHLEKIQYLTATATLDFGSTATQDASDLTITVTGAADGDVVSLGVGSASVLNRSCYTAWVSNADVVTVRFNNYSSSSLDPSSGDFKVTIIK